MEEDDEFGDLYTDVLKPFTSIQSSTPQPDQPSPESAPLNSQIEINLKINDPSSTHRNSANLIDPNQNLVPNLSEIVKDKQISAHEGEFGDKDVKFDIEDDMGNDPVMPGLLSGSGSGELGVSGRDGVVFGGGGGGEGDDWDSDSEDDLHIVLNDDRCGPMGMLRGGMAAEDDDDDDEDGDPLVIVADSEPHQVMEEQEWGGDAGQGGDGERKEGDAAKGSAGMGAAPKMGYSAHGFHPYSQFKYVRPGAAPMPASIAPGSGGQTGQVRPLINMGPFACRGRGDWRATGMRPPMQKGFNSCYGMPMWGAGRGSTNGLDFSLPSRKTIFEVDIDSFEEKPWKHSGVDISDFFNFGLNEESWKEYCKHLEQQRLESTMQSRIRVIDSGRTGQDYDPDMPPELAAATGVLDIPEENGNLGKSDVGHNDQARGSARLRPPIPTGRAIQVESGYGERLPSIDTRPPRIRDSDAVIEIVCQDNSDDNSSTGNDDSECPENDICLSDPTVPSGRAARGDMSGGRLPEEGIPVENEVSDGFQQGYDAKQRELRSKRQTINSIRDGMADERQLSFFPPEAIDQSDPARNKTQSCPGGKLRPSHGSPIARRRRERSPQSASSQRTCDNQREGSVERRDDEHIIASSSPVTSLAEQESSTDQKVAADDETVAVGEDFELENEETVGARATKDNAGGTTCSQKKRKTASQIGQQALQESDGEDSKAARSSETSKARSGSSKEYQKWGHNNEEEVVQVGHNKHIGRVKRHNDERKERVQRREHDGRLETESSHMVVRGRDDFHSRRDMDRSSIHNLHMNSEGFDRVKERDIFDGSLQRAVDNMRSRRARNEDARKRERGEEVDLRHKSKAREGERNYKEEHSSSRNQMNYGPFGVHYNKDVGSRQRERDNSMKIRYENMDDNHSKRRKDEDCIRRDCVDKEEIWHGHRENICRRKRERDDNMVQRRRDEPPRIRENLDDRQSVGHREEGLLQRGRGDKSERDDQKKLKQAHDENLLNQEKEEGQTSMSWRLLEDKSWGAHARMKVEYRSSDRGYQIKDPVRHSERRQGRDESCVRRNHTNYEQKSRHDRSIGHNDHVVEAFDIPRGQGKRHEESIKKVKEPESGTSSGHPKKYQDDQSVRVTETVRGNIGQGNREHEAPPSNKQREDASSSDDQLDTKRGRSKLELSRSHKERDFSIKTKSSASLKFKEVDVNGTGGSLKSNGFHGESAKSVEAIAKEHPSSEAKDISDIQSQDADKNPTEDKHLDTFEKLKKRSERFKLPLPSEKEPLTAEKVETEALPSAKSEVPVQPEIKQERPARKRRWTGK